MSNDEIKKRIENAVGNYIKKHVSDSNKLKRMHGRPEKEVEKSVMQWLSSQNIFATVIESKAVYSAAAGRYLTGQAISGYPDIAGLNDQGLFVAIELKSPGRRSTLRDSQRAFLEQVIHQNGFACCTDSVSHLSSLYFSWLNLDKNARQTALYNDLPRRKVTDRESDTLFDE